MRYENSKIFKYLHQEQSRDFQQSLLSYQHCPQIKYVHWENTTKKGDANLDKLVAMFKAHW